jgi:RecA-family ATPase
VHFRVAGWLPERTTTLLSANGGVGKSNLALQLAVALCTGSQWLGMDVTQSRVLVLSAEDEARTVHFRVANICADVGVDLGVLSGSLTVYDMTQQDCVLWREGVTERMQWLADTVQATRADVVIIDNASDVFASNENDRAEVRGFMRSLNLIAAGLNCAVLLLAHVDKASVRSGAGADTDSTFSGSTAWNNSARSRWAMLREGEAISLRHEKSNFGQRQEEMRLEFDAGAKVFRRFGQIPGAAAARELLRNSHRAAILRLIDTACKAGQKISMSATANNNAFRVLKAAPDFPRMERSEFFSVLYDLQRDGLLTEEEYTVDRKRHKRLALTDVGLTRVAIGSGAPGLWRA